MSRLFRDGKRAALTYNDPRLFKHAMDQERYNAGYEEGMKERSEWENKRSESTICEHCGQVINEGDK